MSRTRITAASYKDRLLSECLNAFNQIPRKKYQGKMAPDTYHLASLIEDAGINTKMASAEAIIETDAVALAKEESAIVQESTPWKVPTEELAGQNAKFQKNWPTPNKWLVAKKMIAMAKKLLETE